MKIMLVIFLIALNALCVNAMGQNSENPFGSAASNLASLKGDIYYLPEGTKALPDFSTLTPVGSIYTKVLDIPTRSFTSGFPGVTDRFEWFAIRYNGTFDVDLEGEYAFRLVSDDGSRLFIDGKKIIDNDGIHPTQSVSGNTYLSRGRHSIEVDYFQGPRAEIALQLFWTPPGGSETISNPQYIENPFGSSKPTSGGELQQLYPVADGEVYAYSYRNWNWANAGMYESMGAGWNPVGGEKRAYLRFDLPAGLDISRAVLKLYQYHSAGPVHSLGVYRVTSPWEEGTNTYHSGEVEKTAAPGELCWMQQPSFDPVPVANFTSAAAVPAWVEVDITPLVQQWQAGTPNYGLVVKTTNEHPVASDPEAKSGFYTKENPDQVHRPVLELSITSQAPAIISDLRGTLNTDSDCNLYVADYSNNQVKRINPDGSATTYASGIDRPRYQLFDSAGNLYVGSFDGNIYKISAGGVKTTVASGIWSPQDMGFDGAGNLYVAGGYDGRIHCIAPSGDKTTIDSGFAHPKHLAVKADGNLYVVDSDGTLIVRITPKGERASLADLGETIQGMATDGEYLYVSHSDKISQIDAYGKVTHIITGLDQPSSLAVCNGNIFVTVKDGIVKTKLGEPM
jgi:hypothetical protein